MNTGAHIVDQSRVVLVDFDGPVCAVFGGQVSDRDAADELRALTTSAGLAVDEATETSCDPFAVLQAVAVEAPELLPFANRRLQELECDAVRTAPTTPGSIDALRSWAERGHVAAIVTNNSEQAAQLFIEQHQICHLVSVVVGRTSGNPKLLKPSPYPLMRAMLELDADPEECVMVGDATTDIEAAQAAGVRSVAYANKRGKRGRFRSAKPGAIVDSMAELVLVGPSV